MKTPKRIKAQPIATRSEFLAIVSELAQLETEKRALEAKRDRALQAVNIDFDERMAPVVDAIKGKFSLAEAYADEHRSELLPKKDVKSVTLALARFGWKTGNRTVALLSRVTADNAIAALKALGLVAYVRTKEEIARDLILADCQDDTTLSVVVGGDREAGVVMKSIPLANAGLKIAQSEMFFIEPTSEAAETLTPATASAA